MHYVLSNMHKINFICTSILESGLSEDEIKINIVIFLTDVKLNGLQKF